MAILNASLRHEPWNKGKLVGQKTPLKLKDIWPIRIRLRLRNQVRDLGLFNLAIDSKLRAWHTMRRTRASLIRGRTGNLRAVQLLLGHTKLESTVRYLGIEDEDALAIAEQTDV